MLNWMVEKGILERTPKNLSSFLSQPIKQIKVLAAHPLVHTRKIQS
jgi:hypothetical protein